MTTQRQPGMSGSQRMLVGELAWSTYCLASAGTDYLHVGDLISEVPDYGRKQRSGGRMSNLTISSRRFETFHAVGLYANIGWTTSMETN
jgi:hypothetical protein